MRLRREIRRKLMGLLFGFWLLRVRGIGSIIRIRIGRGLGKRIGRRSRRGRGKGRD